MAEILSQEEIDALLNIIDEEEDEENNISIQNVKLYDFKRPNLVTKNQFKYIRDIHNKFVINLKNDLEYFLNDVVEISLHSIDQLTYKEFLMTLPYPTSFNIFKTNKEQIGIIEMNPSIVYPLLDKMLGSIGFSYDKNKEFTELEQKLIKYVLDIFIKNVENIWEKQGLKVIDLEIKNSPNEYVTISQNEIVIAVLIELVVGHSSGMINICYPYRYFKDFFVLEKEDNKINSKILKNISELKTKVELGYQTNLTLSDLSNLKIGDIISFDSDKYIFIDNKNKIKLRKD